MDVKFLERIPQRQGRALARVDDQKSYQLLDDDGASDDLHPFNKRQGATTAQAS